MINEDYYRLNGAINNCRSLEGGKFQYALSKNLKIILSEIDSIDTAYKPSEEFENFEKNRIELLKKYCSKDEQGEFILNGNDITFSDKKIEKEFHKSMAELKEVNKEVTAKRDKQMKERSAFLKEEIPAENIPKWYKIKAEDIPHNATGAIYSLEEFLE
jgi:hypothetical protein